MNGRFEYSLGINRVIDGQSNYGASAKVVIEPAKTPFFSLALDTNMSLLEVAEFLNSFGIPFPTDSIVHSLVGKEAIKKLSDPRLVDVAEEMYQRPPKKAGTFQDLVNLVDKLVQEPKNEYVTLVGPRSTEWENAAFIYRSQPGNNSVTYSGKRRQVEYHDRQIVQPRFGTIMNMSPLLSPLSVGYKRLRGMIVKGIEEALLTR